MNIPGLHHFKNIKIFIRYDIPYGFKNLIRWFKIIWNDRNWDYCFIYIILHKKLDLMEKHIRKHSNHTTSKKDADKIKKCVLVLDRLIKDEYFDMAFIEHNKKWGNSRMVTKDVIIEGESKLQCYDVIYPNVKTEDDKKQQLKDFKRSIERENALKQQDIEFLFEVMKRNIQTWWD